MCILYCVCYFKVRKQCDRLQYTVVRYTPEYYAFDENAIKS